MKSDSVHIGVDVSNAMSTFMRQETLHSKTGKTPTRKAPSTTWGNNLFEHQSRNRPLLARHRHKELVIAGEREVFHLDIDRRVVVAVESGGVVTRADVEPDRAQAYPPAMRMRRRNAPDRRNRSCTECRAPHTAP